MKKLLNKITALTKGATKKIRGAINGATKTEKALATLMVGIALSHILFVFGYTTLGLINCVITAVSAKKVLKGKVLHKKPFAKRVFSAFNNLVLMTLSELRSLRKNVKAFTKKEKTFCSVMLVVGYTLCILVARPTMAGALLLAGVILAQSILLGLIDFSGIAKLKKLKTKTQELLSKASEMSIRERWMMLILASEISISVSLTADWGLIGLILSHAFVVALGVRLGIIGIEEAEKEEDTVPQKTNN